MQNKKRSYYCDHCKVQGHSTERCWKIHGSSVNYRPDTWRKDTIGKANAVHNKT